MMATATSRQAVLSRSRQRFARRGQDRAKILVMRTRTRALSALNGSVAGVALVALIALLALPLHDRITTATAGLALVLPTLAAAYLGGRRAAIVSALAATVAFNLAYLEPYGTLKVNFLDDGIALVVFLLVAVAVGTLVALEAERRELAERRAAENLQLYEQREELAAAKQEAEQVGDYRSALLRSVSHDLRTPLATIRAVSSDLRDGGGDYDEATKDELLDLVVDEAERLDRLVANLLSLSRIEAGALKPERQAVDVGELVTDRVRRLKRLLRDRRLQVDVPFTLPLADVDYTLVDQVVTNLLENAVRHSPAGSTIRVRARERGAWVEVAVSDQGPGVDPELQDQLFEPFRPGEGGASGVGLAICRAIVEVHGGSIAAGQANGGGAELVFTVPVRGVA
jgi:K+-sensing histidine kinase KdpD